MSAPVVRKIDKPFLPRTTTHNCLEPAPAIGLIPAGGLHCIKKRHTFITRHVTVSMPGTEEEQWWQW